MRYKKFSTTASGLTIYTTAYKDGKIEYMYVEYPDGFDFVDLRNKDLTIRYYDDQSNFIIGSNSKIMGKSISYELKFYIDKNFDIIKGCEL